jgi:adenylate cyclase
MERLLGQLIIMRAPVAIEIERKFIVGSDDWRSHVTASRTIRQGYILRTGPLSVRVRTINGGAFLTIKNRVPGVAREEFEYAIPLDDAGALLAHCDQPLIEKVRHDVDHGGKTWVVDEFQDFRAGLLLAECELERADEAISLPNWVGREVTNDPAYRNEAL